MGNTLAPLTEQKGGVVLFMYQMYGVMRTYKCKLEHESGYQQINYSEFSTDDFPVPGGSCYNTISLEGEKGMWTAQCFGVWNSGD